MAKRQFNVRIDEAVYERLTMVLSRYPRISQNEIVEDLILNYLDFWEQTQQVHAQEIQRQKEMIKNKLTTST